MAVAAPRRSHQGVPPRPRAPGGPPRVRGPAPVPLQIAGALLSLPFAVVNTGLRLVFRTIGFSLTLAGAVAQRVLPRPLANSLQGAVQSLTQGPRDEDPAASAATFSQTFTQAYGERHPLWQPCGWQDASVRAQNEGKFLFVYLHSPRHQDTASFCRDTLAAPALVDYVNSTLVSWGGDLRRADAFRLSSSLRAAAFPYCALLAFSGARCVAS